MDRRKQGFSLAKDTSKRLHALSFALGKTKSAIVEAGIASVMETLTVSQRRSFEAACQASR